MGNVFDAARMKLPRGGVRAAGPATVKAKPHGAGIVLEPRERRLLEDVLHIGESKLVDLLCDPANLDEVNRMIAVAEKLAPPEPTPRVASGDGMLFESGRFPGLERKDRPVGWFRSTEGIHNTHDGAPMMVTPDPAAKGDPVPRWWAEQHPGMVPEGAE